MRLWLFSQNSHVIVGAIATVMAILVTTPSRADVIETVNWADDVALDGAGAGTLANGGITVNYTTVVGVGNAGVRLIPNDWGMAFGTDGAMGMGVTHPSGGILGTIPGAPQPQAITFSSPVTNPILYINFGVPSATMDFGPLALTFLDSFNAQLNGSQVTFLGSTNSFHDGFAAIVHGTFGPGNPLTFDFQTTASFDSVGFTVSNSTPVPEPTSLCLMALGLATYGCVVRARRRRTVGV